MRERRWGERLRKGQDIAERLKRLAAECLKLAATLPKHPALRNVSVQLARAASASGALYAEGRAAQSRAEFIHKLSLAAKELQETIYWLELARDAEAIPASRVASWIDEATQLSAILGASIRTARENARRID
jgi:four helix bundle protein